MRSKAEWAIKHTPCSTKHDLGKRTRTHAGARVTGHSSQFSPTLSCHIAINTNTCSRMKDMGRGKGRGGEGGVSRGRGGWKGKSMEGGGEKGSWKMKGKGKEVERGKRRVRGKEEWRAEGKGSYVWRKCELRKGWKEGKKWKGGKQRERGKRRARPTGMTRGARTTLSSDARRKDETFRDATTR